MSDQRRTDLSQPMARNGAARAPSSRSPYAAGLKKRVPYYIGALVIAILTLAWIDGGEEPLHSITQTVELTDQAAGT